MGGTTSRWRRQRAPRAVRTVGILAIFGLLGLVAGPVGAAEEGDLRLKKDPTSGR